MGHWVVQRSHKCQRWHYHPKCNRYAREEIPQVSVLQWCYKWNGEYAGCGADFPWTRLPCYCIEWWTEGIQEQDVPGQALHWWLSGSKSTSKIRKFAPMLPIWNHAYWLYLNSTPRTRTAISIKRENRNSPPNTPTRPMEFITCCPLQDVNHKISMMIRIPIMEDED